MSIQNNTLLPTSTALIHTNVPLHDKNWFQTGGPARYFAAPTTTQEFQDALAFAHTHNLAIFILGKGANVLISDDGFDGLVIQPQLRTITHTPRDASTVHVTAGAGVDMADLITYCLANNILGLEEFSGIPGTVGGSVYINLHYFQFLLEHFLLECQVIERATGAVLTVPPAWFKFGYNQSTLQEHAYYLLSATFALKPCTDLEAAYARGRSVEIIRHRAQRYPQSHTCGSFFRNFHDHEVTLTTPAGKKLIFVAYYLDKIGVKGALKVGDAQVSYQHANMLVNCGKATSADLIGLARTMQERVWKEFGIIPQTECLLVGFKEYPLLQTHSSLTTRETPDLLLTK
jgi:UDP-N-acetylmuramate dehydrogenase